MNCAVGLSLLRMSNWGNDECYNDASNDSIEMFGISYNKLDQANWAKFLMKYMFY